MEKPASEAQKAILIKHNQWVEGMTSKDASNKIAVIFGTNGNPKPSASKAPSVAYSDRDKSIVAQCLTKIWGDKAEGPQSVENILVAYRAFLERL